MKKYTVFVVYSSKGNNYTEIPYLKSTHKLFDTPEGAIEAIKNEVEQEYGSTSSRKLELVLPEIKRDSKTGNCWIYAGYFNCLYTEGPLIHYDIYINSINID